MLQAFQTYICDESLFAKTDKLVLAVSGGVDSMVMLDLFQQSGYEFCVAHCNFRLRGAESDGDEVFIRDYCGEHGLELYVKHFDTREHADLEGISIEMAARQLRYGWFRQLRAELLYDYIVTAHHQDDLIETMLINLSRGTGIRGLTGIQAKNGEVVRPLLFASRQQILEYAATRLISYQHDSTNDELVYQRNIIRHRIIPLFEELNPAFRRNAAKTAAILKDTREVYQQKLEEIRSGVEMRERDNVLFPVSGIQALQPKLSLLFELFHPYGFNADQIEEIAGSLTGESGKSFFSKTHRLVKDRDRLILTEFSKEPECRGVRYYIDEHCSRIDEPISLTFGRMDKDAAFRFSTDPKVADLDYNQLQFPLILKKWERGEYFQPLGMSGLKKLSDFFIDEKLSIPEKEACWILYSGKKVVWVVGRRIDDRFKITHHTQQVLRIRLG